MIINKGCGYNLDFLKSIFLSTWFEGLIVSIIVTVLGSLLRGYREKKLYINKVNMANIEVFNAIKILIPEKRLLEKEMLTSLHNATADKYKVKAKDMNSLYLILDELIKEILESSFLTHKEKVEYCNIISDAKNDLHNRSEDNKTITLKIEEELDHHMAYITHQRRTMLALSLPMITLLYALIFGEITSTNYTNKRPMIILITMFMSALSALIMIQMSNRIKNRSLNKIKKNKDGR